ncbi:putative holin [Bordetella bronchiseptica]|uniref:putative holin n=1 Tax=Bordetella bronchiseptica TaxID=518 RepID=UPI0005282FFB|nr:putative holin [Bordetella bronchiseptica]
MAEPASTAGAAAATASGVLFAALLPGIDSGALIGAFAGAAVFMMHSKEVGIAKRLAYGLVSWLLGYFGAPELGRLVGVHETVVTGFVAAAVAVTIAVTAIERIKAFDISVFWKRGG